MTPTTEEQRAELMPCPFCGSTPIEDGKSDYLRIRCEECDTRGPTFDFDGEDDDDIERARQDAIAAWNRRSPPPAAEGVWQPIETAPTDGARILAWSKDEGWRETYWRFYGEGSIAREHFKAGQGPSGAWDWTEPHNNWACSWRPTHWMPLPKAPAITKAGKKGEDNG